MVGRQGTHIAGVVLHHTASSLQGAIQTFTTSSGRSGGGTSAHFIVDRDGTRYQVVDTADTAFADGIFAVNLDTISIEHVRLWWNGPGTAGYEPITDAQYASSHELCSILAADNHFTLSAFTVKPHRYYVADICPGDLDVNRVIQGPTEENDTMKILKVGAAAWLLDALGGIRNLTSEQYAAYIHAGVSEVQMAQGDVDTLTREVGAPINQLLAQVAAAKSELDALSGHPAVSSDPQLLALVQQIRSKFS